MFIGIETHSQLTCPTSSCRCPLDKKGRRLVVCSNGGLLDPLPVLDMPKDTEVLIVKAPLDNPNALTLGPIFKGHLKLEEIHVTHSEVPALGAHSFWGLRKLRVLNVSHNELSVLMETDFRGPEILEVLDLSNNRIESVPSAVFRHLTELKSLDLSRNRIPDLVPRIFYGLSKLEKLDLSNNPLGSFPFDRFSDIPKLQELKCMRCGLLTLTSNVLGELPGLRLLDLRHNRLTQVPSVSPIIHLNTLLLDGNHIKSLEQGRLYGLKFKYLSLSNNNINKIDTATFINTSISNLDLSYNKLASLDSRTFEPIISKIKDLDMSGNTLIKDHLLFIFPKARQLRKLRISNAGLTHIPSEMLRRSRHLRYLNISSNFLSSFPRELLFSIPHLQTLDLSDNSFHGVKEELIDTFKSMKYLSKVKISGNPWICEECEVGPLINWLKTAIEQPNSIKACTGLGFPKNCLRCSGPSPLSNETMLLLNEEHLPSCGSLTSSDWPAWANEQGSQSELIPIGGNSNSTVSKPEAKIDNEPESVVSFFKDHLALLVGVGCGLLLALLLVIVFAMAISKRQTALYYTSNEGDDTEPKEKLMGRNNNDSPVIQNLTSEPIVKLPSYSPMAISLVHARTPIKSIASTSTSSPKIPYSPKSIHSMNTIEEGTSLHSTETEIL